MPTSFRGVLLTCALLALAAVAGCKTQPPISTPGIHDVERDWLNKYPPTPDTYPAPEQTVASALAATFGADPGPIPPQPVPAGPPINVLVLSGGGKFGAYSTGVLAGWQCSGTRPQFDVVTGVSTGAIIAPLVFLGPQYDAQLKDYFTTMERSDLFNIRPLRGIHRNDALADPAPLKAIIERQVSEQFVADMRQAHLQGRRCFIGTTNLMTHRLTIWDLGAIAASGRPDATALVRQVILAACSIPGFLPPVEFDVTVDGRCFHELHGDAGNVTQGFVRTANGLPPGSNVYAICAGYLYSPPRTERPGFLGLATRGVSDSLDALFRADLVNMYTHCAVSHASFNLISMPPTIKSTGGSMAFDPAESKVMYATGYQMGASGTAWRHSPPGTLPGENTIPRTGLDFVTR